MNSEPAAPFLIAAVQATPVFLDRAATVEKACALIAEAGRAGARLAVFPEGFIPTYPLWAWFIPPGRTQELRELYTDLLENSISVPGDEVDQLCRAAAAARVNVVMGINERNAEASGTTLYNAMLFIGADGRLLGSHRKLVPTVAERLVHGQGDGSSLGVHDLDIGRLGGLICWENYMPLARYALYAWGVQIYVAPTWDRGEPWTSTLRHIAKEGRVYVVGCCTPMRRDDIPDRYAFKSYLPDAEWLNPGESMIIDPDGKFLVEPVRNREEILYAEINPRNMKGPRFQLDVAGHYARPELFELTVNRIARPMVRLNEQTAGGGRHESGDTSDAGGGIKNEAGGGIKNTE
jgi:nitrilase